MACKLMLTTSLGVRGHGHYLPAARALFLSSPVQSRSFASTLPWPYLVSSCAARRVPIPRCYQDRPNASIENLRSQLESLNAEAEQAQAKANAARARFMRLTETVENLRTRAVIDLKSGKEESARQLIAEKQKVMVALEKAKQRAELLEELSNKLGEVISSKEVQLIAALSSGNVGLVESNSVVTNVRIVSPRADELVAADGVVVGGDKENGGSVNEDARDQSSPFVEGVSDLEEPSDDIVTAVLSSRPELYSQFLSRMDKKLHEVETELKDFLNVAAMVLPEDISLIENKKVATVEQTWQDVLSARARIRKVVRQEGFG